MSRVLDRFTVTTRGGEEVRLRIQEAGVEGGRAVVDFMVHNHFYTEEPINSACGVTRTEQSTAEIRELLEYLTAPGRGTSLVCCVDTDGGADSADIVACNPLNYDSSYCDALLDIERRSPELQRLMRAVSLLPHAEPLLNVPAVLEGVGMLVLPNYRGCGLATRLLEARKSLMSTLGLPATAAWFTSAGSQRAARRAGYREVARVSAAALARGAGGLAFPDHNATFLLMAYP